MLGLGAGEILVIVLIALLILGPTAFPGFARSAGKTLKEFRSVKDDFTRELQISLDEPDHPKSRYDDLDDRDVTVYAPARKADQRSEPTDKEPEAS